MFTGIVTATGVVARTEERGDLRVVVETAMPLADAALGASIACSGCCLTVVDKGANWFAVDVSGETRALTPEGRWAAGSRLNLERALRVGDELGGHIVTGHVDGVGEVVAVVPEGDSHRVTVRAPSALAPYLAPKGSVAVDGVSLTVNTVEDGPAGTVLGVNIIPHTWTHTTLADLEVGHAVNLEIDTLARYLRRLETYCAM